jgi:hypothetical protein
MSDGSEDLSRVLAYAVEALQLDPQRDAERIITRRIEFLRGGDSGPDRKPDHWAVRQIRRQAIEDLYQLRQNFWTLSQDELDAKLRQTAAADAPELQPAVSRLQIVARNRQAFLELATSDANPSFVDMMKDVLVLSPRETAPLKEAIRQALRRPIWRRSRRQFLLRMQTQLPELCQLEWDWLELVLRQRTRLTQPRRSDAVPRMSSKPPSVRKRSIKGWHTDE